MPRDRQRATLDSGRKLDLVRLIPSGNGQPGTIISMSLTYGSGEVIACRAELGADAGRLAIEHRGGHQAFRLEASPRHFGGLQWYVVCPRTWKRVRVLYRPNGATLFASRHAWGRRAAYASQFLTPIDRAWRTKAKVKARLLGDADPDERDLPPRPKGMRQSTYERWEAKYDAAEEVLEQQCAMALARFLKKRG
ncbi:MAG TPA: hypothetical protein VIL09_07630 [Microvirga sp.]|jgi:hypothetical protein